MTEQAKEVYHLNPGTRLCNDRYIIGVALGSGGFGIVYKAWDDHLSAEVAIKEYYPAGMVNRVPGKKEVIVYKGARETEFKNGLSHFEEEAKKMAQFDGCENIAAVYNFFEENNTAYLVMEYMQGLTLTEYLDMRGGKIDEKTMAEIAVSVAKALKTIHKKRIIHGDISPKNIYLCEGNTVKIFDFGAAIFSPEDRKTMAPVLTPGYAPPEQYAGKGKIGPWTDIYALGATIYRAVTGQIPQESTNRTKEAIKKGKDPLIRPRQLEPSISKELERIILLAMAVQPELRFPDIDKLIYALEKKQLVDEVAIILKKRKRRRLAGILAALIVVSGLCMMAYRISVERKNEARVLSEAEVDVWVPCREGETEEELSVMYEAMSEEFVKYYEESGVTVEISCIPEAEYQETLRAAFENGTGPDLFESSDLSGDIMVWADSLEEVLSWEEAKDCLFLTGNQYQEAFPEMDKLPLGFTMPVLYANPLILDEVPETVTDREDLFLSGGLCVAVNSLQLSNYLNIYYGETLDPESNIAIEAPESYEAYLDYLKKNKAPLGTEGWERSMFEQGKLAYYLSDTSGYRMIQKAVPKGYCLLKLENDTLIGRFTDEWSVNVDSPEAEKEAAKVLLSYFLTQKAQIELHFNSAEWKSIYAMPVNRYCFEKYITDMNDEFKILEDQTGVLRFAGDGQIKVDQQNRELMLETELGN